MRATTWCWPPDRSGLGRGLLDVASLNAVHKRMLKQLAAVGGRIDAIFYCPHAPEDACTCRKPLPGLIEQVADRFGIELKDVPFVQATVCVTCQLRRQQAARHIWF